jgi:cell division protein FtsW
MITGLRTRALRTRVIAASREYLATPYASVQLLLFSGGGLLLIGIMMSASTTISASAATSISAAESGGMWSQLIREFAYLALSVPVFWLGIRMAPRSYRRLAYPALGIAFILLAGVLAPGFGVTINSARRWLQLGPITAQPSEFAKLAVLLWGADLLARKKSKGSLGSVRHILVPLVPCFVAVGALVMLEPDLGTTLCFVLLLLGLLWMVGLPVRYFIAMLLAVSGAVTLLAVSAPSRMVRLTTFLHPNLDPSNTGYHTIQGLYALASGGIFGVGLGQGTAKYGWVPNANTDYVFAIIGQELGLLGCIVVLVLFAVFTFAAMRVARRSANSFVCLVASGTAIWIAGQALINIGYVTALLPVTGIPLPFISNGGTSLLLTCGVLGMLISFARHEPAAVEAAQRAAEAGTAPRWLARLRLGVPQPVEPDREPAVRPKPAVAAVAPHPRRAPVRQPAAAQVRSQQPRRSSEPVRRRA